MIDILKQHARERRLTIILFAIATLILFLIQWRIGFLAADLDSVIPTESQ